MQVTLQVYSLGTGINLLCQDETKGKKCYTVNEVIILLEFLIEKIFVEFGR